METYTEILLLAVLAVSAIVFMLMSISMCLGMYIDLYKKYRGQ